MRSDAPLVLYTLEGNDCGGAEIECKISAVPPTGGPAEVSVSISANGEVDADYTIVISDRFKDGSDTYDIEVSCAAVC